MERSWAGAVVVGTMLQLVTAPNRGDYRWRIGEDFVTVQAFGRGVRVQLDYPVDEALRLVRSMELSPEEMANHVRFYFNEDAKIEHDIMKNLNDMISPARDLGRIG
jgi:hypothetical protein